MSDALAFLFILVLVGLGWKQSYSDHVNGLLHPGAPAREFPVPATPAPLPKAAANVLPAPVAPAAAQPPADRTWMFEKTAMDGPTTNRIERKAGPNGR